MAQGLHCQGLAQSPGDCLAQQCGRVFHYVHAQSSNSSPRRDFSLLDWRNMQCRIGSGWGSMQVTLLLEFVFSSSCLVK